MWGDGMKINEMKIDDWFLAAIIVWVFSFLIVKFTELPVVQINTDGECVQVLFTDEFECGFLPDKYITEHMK